MSVHLSSNSSSSSVLFVKKKHKDDWKVKQ